MSRVCGVYVRMVKRNYVRCAHAHGFTPVARLNFRSITPFHFSPPPLYLTIVTGIILK